MESKLIDSVHYELQLELDNTSAEVFLMDVNRILGDINCRDQWYTAAAIRGWCATYWIQQVNSIHRGSVDGSVHALAYCVTDAEFLTVFKERVLPLIFKPGISSVWITAPRLLGEEYVTS